MELRYKPGEGWRDELPSLFMENFEWDEDRQGWIIAQDDTYDYMVLSGYTNARLVLSPRENHSPVMWHFGWCFATQPLAVAALTAWNPETQDEPMMWHKRPSYNRVRKAPRRGEDADYNHPRCVHGSYMGEPCRIDAYCETNPESGRIEWVAAGRPAMW
jgi:hypothetical protein